MTSIVQSVRAEFLRYKTLAEGALSQLSAAELVSAGSDAANAPAVICWHIAGNLRSRFTDFLTSDGEKPWRHREEEFARRAVTMPELLAHWERGWSVLFQALDGLRDEQLSERITIRGQPFQVHEALHRALAHISYHVGQLVYVGRSVRGSAWRFLSIPPGQSEAYNARPAFDRPEAHTAKLRSDPG